MHDARVRFTRVAHGCAVSRSGDGFTLLALARWCNVAVFVPAFLFLTQLSLHPLHTYVANNVQRAFWDLTDALPRRSTCCPGDVNTALAREEVRLAVDADAKEAPGAGVAPAPADDNAPKTGVALRESNSLLGWAYARAFLQVPACPCAPMRSCASQSPLPPAASSFISIPRAAARQSQGSSGGHCAVDRHSHRGGASLCHGGRLSQSTDLTRIRPGQRSVCSRVSTLLLVQGNLDASPSVIMAVVGLSCVGTTLSTSLGCAWSVNTLREREMMLLRALRVSQQRCIDIQHGCHCGIINCEACFTNHGALDRQVSTQAASLDSVEQAKAAVDALPEPPFGADEQERTESLLTNAHEARRVQHARAAADAKAAREQAIVDGVLAFAAKADVRLSFFGVFEMNGAVVKSFALSLGGTVITMAYSFLTS